MKLSENKEKIEVSIDISDVLQLIPNRDIVEYARDNFDMIHEDDAEDYCNCETTHITDFDDYELIDEINRRGYTVHDINPSKQSVVREIAVNKILETINSMSDFELNAIANKLI